MSFFSLLWLRSFFFLIPTALVSAELATGWSKQGGVYLWIKEVFAVHAQEVKNPQKNYPRAIFLARTFTFVAPFADPHLKWDFRLEQVKSISASGHKFGLVYAGLGWILWRDESDFPEELIFKVNYLGGLMPTYTLNFSKGSAMVVAQYYNFLRLGRKGYREIMSMRIVVKENLSRDMTDILFQDIINACDYLEKHGAPKKSKPKKGIREHRIC